MTEVNQDLGTGSGDANDHVREYLTFYLNFPHPPHFAVLLAGAWGVGKTHLLRAFLKNEMSDRRVAYVSLYGMKRKEDVEEGLFAALYPRASGKAARIAGGVVKALLKHVRYEEDFTKADFLNKFAADIYVFDDLERIEMPLNEALGYINEFVEHDGCKVIIVANVEEIREAEQDDFKRRREKIVGKILEVRSTLDEAYGFFCSKIDSEETRKFLVSASQEIADLYRQSDLQNLRILQQTMWDFERIYECLTERLREHEIGMLILTRLFFALSFEVKAGRLATRDLTDRINGVVSGSFKKESSTPISIANGRYSSIELYETMLNDDVIHDLLITGVIDCEAIRASLNQSAHFSTGEEPAWRVVWGAFERDDSSVENAIRTMNEQFEQREFSTAGEILHVVGLQLYLSNIGAIDYTRPQIVEHAKAYIDDARHLRKLELRKMGWDSDLTLGSYGGLGLYERDTEEMGEILHYLRDAQIGAVEDSYPEKAEKLLRELQSAPELFVRRITNNSTDSTYPLDAVLAYIRADDFVGALLDLKALDQLNVLRGLDHRYESLRLQNELRGEKEWLQEVLSQLCAAADSAASPLTKARLNKIVGWTIEKRFSS